MKKFETQPCYPGFLAWNNFWIKFFTRENVGTGLNAITQAHRWFSQVLAFDTNKTYKRGEKKDC